MFRTLFFLFIVFLISGPGSTWAQTGEGLDLSDSGLLSVHSDLELTPPEIEFLKKHPVIRVGNEDDWPPFDFSQHGEPRGYAIEHLELLGERLGISFEYLNGYTWAELLELFKDGRIDLLPSLWYSRNRAEYMLFTEPFLVLPYVIVTHSNDSSIQNFNDLYGKTVAVARGYVQEEVLEDHYPQINRYYVDNVLEGLRAVSYGQADAYIGYHGSVSYLMASKFLFDLQIVGETRVPELGPQGLYIAVRPDMEPLRDILQKAMDSLPEEEKIRLRDKWMALEQPSGPEFTEEERRFLLENPVLKVDNLQYWAPFNFNEDGAPRGFSIDFMELVADRTGIEFEYISGPTWNEFMVMLQTGDIDILCDVVRTEQREQEIAFTKPYFNIFSGIVVKKGKEEGITELADLAGKRIAVPQTFYYQEILEENFPDIQVLPLKNSLQCLEAVSSGRADAALSEKPVFDFLINRHFLMDLTSIPVVGSDTLRRTQVALGVRKDRQVLQSILQKSMDAVPQEEIDDLRDKWLRSTETEEQASLSLSSEEKAYISNQNSVSMCVNPSWLPFEELTAAGKYRGMVAGIMTMLEERIGIPFEVKRSENWEESLKGFQAGECQILSTAQNSGLERDDLSLTKPYLESMTVMVTRDDYAYIPDMQSLTGTTVAMVENDPVLTYIRTNYPELDIVTFSSLDRVLMSVSKNENQVAIGNMHRVSSKIHDLSLYDLKIAGQTPYKEFFRAGVDPDQPLLRSIMDKAIDDLTAQEINSIVRQWISIRYEQPADYTLVWQIGLGAAFLILLFMYWNRKLFMLNQEIARAHEDLEVKTKELERLSTTDSLTGAFNRMKIE
ncbi:MAG: transporter substrate-binding domain-containing protein, partial [Desulfonatronovibrio sp.]